MRFIKTGGQAPPPPPPTHSSSLGNVLQYNTCNINIDMSNVPVVVLDLLGVQPLLKHGVGPFFLFGSPTGAGVFARRDSGTTLATRTTSVTSCSGGGFLPRAPRYSDRHPMLARRTGATLPSAVLFSSR